MKKILFFLSVICLSLNAKSQSSLVYAYVNVANRTQISSNVYDVTFNRFTGGYRPYPNSNQYTVNDIQIGDVFFLACYRFTITQVTQRTPNLILRVTDTTLTTILSSTDAVGLRTVIGRERQINGVPVNLYFNIADNNSGTQMGVNSITGACIYSYYNNNFQYLLNTGGLANETRVCGPPTSPATSAISFNIIDSCNHLLYTYAVQTNTWYNYTNIESESAPQITYTSGGTNVSNERVSWKKPSTNAWYDVVNNVWKNRKEIYVDSIFYTDNDWYGLNNFNNKTTMRDSLNAEKGVNSKGLVDTKGLKSEADSTKVAIDSKGAMKGKYRLITANDSLDTKDFFIEVVCSTGDIIIKCPPLIDRFKDVFYAIKRTDDTPYKVYFQRPIDYDLKIVSKTKVVLRYSDNNWNFD